MTPVSLGYVPLCDAAALIVGHAMGFFADEGLAVTLSREASWATIRDKLAVGALDGAHMLAPMVVAQSLGLGCEPTEILAPTALGRGGAALTISSRLSLGDDPAAGLLALVDRRREADASLLTFSVVFPYSIHNYLLRNWMCGAGVDPDHDVRITVAAPPRMAALLAGGAIEGFCAGEPWNAVAEEQAVGRVAVRIADLAPQALDKVFGVPKSWASRDPAALQAVLRALARAMAWAGDPANRESLAELLAEPEHLGASSTAIARGLKHIRFDGDIAAKDADWLLAQMVRWGQVDRAEKARVLGLFDPGAFGGSAPGA